MSATQRANLTRAHEIPNQRVDRSIQITLEPGWLMIDYEVGLTELTLTQDLRALIGTLPGADRAEWLARYAEITGPLNAKGILVTIDGFPVNLTFAGYDLVTEEHPRYTFHFKAILPAAGAVSVRDTNFGSSEGTSRLAIRGRAGVSILDNDGPENVEQVPIQPLWQLGDEEEKRTRQVRVRFGPAAMASGLDSGSATSSGAAVRATATETAPSGRARETERSRWPGIAALLDRHAGASGIVMLGLAVLLGAAHAIQPGHGKTLVTSVALNPDAGVEQAILLGLSATLAHLGSVLLVAVVLWYTGATRVATIHQGLSQAAGFVIAGAGLWRVGRSLGGYAEHAQVHFSRDAARNSGIIGLGLASGAIPCWDAVGLLLVAAAIGRLSAGVALVVAFSVGMALVLSGIAWLAWKMKAAAVGVGTDRSAIWERRLSLACGLAVAAIGLCLFLD